MTEYSVKINRRDGALEVTGDKAWVEEKLLEFADVITAPFSNEPADTEAVKGLKPASRSRRKTKAATPATPKSNRRRTSGSTRIKNLDLAPKGKKSFEAFVAEKQPKSQHDKNAASVYYLSEIAEIAPVTSHHVFTCYRDRDWAIPPSMAQSLFLTANKKAFLDTSDLDDIKIVPRGVNHVERGLTPKTKKN